MNTIITSNVVDPNVEQPWKSTSLQFLEDSQKETFANTIISLIGNTYSSSQLYVLWGCVRSGAADGDGSGAAAVTAGAVFINGEVYTVPPFSTANIDGQSLYTALAVTNGSPDPTQFSDGSSFNVHNVRQWHVVQAGSGTNILSGAVYFNDGWHNVGDAGEPSFTNSWTNFIGNIGFKKLGNFLYLRGVCTGGANNTSVFTLPAAYRPSRAYYVAGNVPANVTQFVSVTINSSGTVVIEYTAGTSAMSLDGIQIPLD